MTPFALFRRGRAVAAAAAFVLAAPFAPAQNPELDAGRQRLEELRARVERLEQQGRHEEARGAAQQAEHLAERLHRASRRGDRVAQGGEREDAQLERILDGLERGIDALRALDRQDALEVLEGVADEVRRERRGQRVERDATRRDATEGKEHPEIRAAREQLEVFRLAQEGLATADRGDSAELMQLAARSLELRLEGVEGEEAEAIHRQAPNHAQTTELLALAARVLHEQGRDERAQAVGGLAERFGERYRRAEREQESQRGERGGGGELERLRQDLRKLHAAIEDLGRRMDELRARSPAARGAVLR